MIRDLVIVGSGPAGYTAAIYASRAQLNPVQYEGSVTAGGALMTTTEVENFPGFVDGVMGPVLMEDMRKQAARFGTELITDDVVEMDLKGDVKTVKDGSGNVVQARAVILAMGSAYKKIGLLTKIVYLVVEFPGVQHVMDSFLEIKLLLLSVAEIPQLKRQHS